MITADTKATEIFAQPLGSEGAGSVFPLDLPMSSRYGSLLVDVAAVVLGCCSWGCRKICVHPRYGRYPATSSVYGATITLTSVRHKAR